jgi:hypothetical protein
MDKAKGHFKRMSGWIIFDAGLLTLVLSIGCSSLGGLCLSVFLLGSGIYLLIKGIDEEFK